MNNTCVGKQEIQEKIHVTFGIIFTKKETFHFLTPFFAFSSDSEQCMIEVLLNETHVFLLNEIHAFFFF